MVSVQVLDAVLVVGVVIVPVVSLAFALVTIACGLARAVRRRPERLGY